MSDSNNPGKKTSKPRNRNRKRGEDLSNYVFGKVMPQATPLEEAVLGAIMLDKEALAIVLDILRAESFYLDAHQLIYKAMLRLFEKSQPIDLLTVMEELKKGGELENIGGPAYLAELTNRVASAANIEYHARLISQKYIQRELITTSTKIIRDAYEDTTDVFQLLDDAEQGLFSIAQQNMSRGYDSMGSLASKALKQLEELKNREDGLTGVPTGFTDLDRLTSGWQPSDLIILAARPGMGKTSFVLSLAKNAAGDFGKGIAIFSLEMSSLQLAQRIISMEAEIAGQKMRNGQLEEYEWQQLHTAIERISEAPLYIDDTPGINVFELRAKCRRLKMQHDIQMVVIDYLQLMSGGGDNQKGNREQEVSAISRALKGLAKELEVPVIALSQLSRAVEVRGGTKRPQLSDLRESGCLTGDTQLRNAETGESITIQELAEREEQTPVQVMGMSDNYKVEAQTLTKAFYSGRKEVFQLKTRSGRTVNASANHPFRKLEGWTRLDQLHVGDRIAIPRNMKYSQYDGNDFFENYKTTPSDIIGLNTYQEEIIVAEKGKRVKELENSIDPDTDIIPKEAWNLFIKPQMRANGITQQAFTDFFGIKKSSATYKTGISRKRLTKILELLPNEQLHNLANSDLYWDEIVSITPLGIQDVYDATIEGVHNFVANDVIVHNSIEQDADMVAFIYRPEYYQILEDEEGQSLKGVAEIIIAKNRHGALKTVKLKFTDQFARFSDLDDINFDELPGDTFENPMSNIITRPSKMNDDEDIPF